MATKKQDTGDITQRITISPPNFQLLQVGIVGTAPMVQSRFTEKARRMMYEKQAAGSTSSKGAKRDPRDFDADYEAAHHRSEEGWYGVPASAFRSACIEACRMAGFQMTRAKMSIFIESDGLDVHDGIPLVRLVAGEPERTEMIASPGPGKADIRVRPMWRQWGVDLVVKFDADQFTSSDVVNLLNRAGTQVGVQEGRPFSKKSAGMGWGTFAVATQDTPQ